MINHKLVRKLYPLPRMAVIKQQLEDFQYATSLDLNMEYYTIRLSPASQDMTTIVTEFVKFRYNRLPMGMCSLGDIFQDKVNKLLGDVEAVKTYIDDILVLSKESFYKHTDKLRIIYGTLHATYLKLNALKCSFVLNYIH